VSRRHTHYQTERLLLSTPTPRDARRAQDYYLRNREFLKEWEPARTPEFYTRAHQQKLLRTQLREMKAGRAVSLWLSLGGEPERIIGFVGASNIVRGSFHSCFLGYKLDAELTGRGFMSEALAAFCRVLFQEHKLHRLEANIRPENAASIRVVEKLGFVYEGRSRDYLFINGAWRDHLHYALLSDSAQQSSL